jgi:hypothetical protein
MAAPGSPSNQLGAQRQSNPSLRLPDMPPGATGTVPPRRSGGLVAADVPGSSVTPSKPYASQSGQPSPSGQVSAQAIASAPAPGAPAAADAASGPAPAQTSRRIGFIVIVLLAAIAAAAAVYFAIPALT